MSKMPVRIRFIIGIIVLLYLSLSNKSKSIGGGAKITISIGSGTIVGLILGLIDNFL